MLFCISEPNLRLRTVDTEFGIGNIIIHCGLHYGLHTLCGLCSY